MAEAPAQDDDLWDDLFGDDEEAAPDQPKEKKDKKDKKEKKEKKDKKDKKHKKEKKDAETTAFEEALEEELPSSLPASLPAAVLPVLEATQLQEDEAEDEAAEESERREKKKKKKDKEKHDGKRKKDKKEKKEKKSKKDRGERGEKRSADEAFPPTPSPTEVEHKAPATPLEAPATPLVAPGTPLVNEVPAIAPHQEPIQAESPHQGQDQVDERLDELKPTVEEDVDKQVDDVVNDPLFHIFEDEDLELPVDVADSEGAAAMLVERDGKTQQAPNVMNTGQYIPVLPSLPGTRKKRKTASTAAGKDAKVEEEPSIAKRFYKVLETIKVVRPLSIKEQDCLPYVKDMIEEMKSAAEMDLQAYHEGKPMLHKMAMLKKAVDVMGKLCFGEMFVAFDGCRALGMWLKELPNGLMPNVQLRTALLQCMLRLPITKEALANCKDTPLGHIVAKMAKSPVETVSNKKLAGLLVQRWVKQVLQKNDTDMESAPPEPQLDRPPPLTLESLAMAEVESLERCHPQIPVVGLRAYHIQPLPSYEAVKRDKVALDTNRGKLGEVLKVLQKPNKKTWKPYSVSIAGRQLNAI